MNDCGKYQHVVSKRRCIVKGELGGMQFYMLAKYCSVCGRVLNKTAVLPEDELKKFNSCKIVSSNDKYVDVSNDM